MKNNIKGLSIIFAMIFVVLISLMVLYILEYMIPFSRDTKGIENSSASYYEAMKGIEDGLFFAKENELTNTSSISPEYKLVANTNLINTTLPFSGKGNSETDKDYNIINSGNPIQLEIGNNRINSWNDNIKMYFKVPDLDGDSSTIETLSGGTMLIINWQLSGSGKTLSATGNFFDPTIINGVTGEKIRTLLGRELTGTTDKDLETFYGSNCGVGEKCSLKFSVVNELKTSAGVSIPYLEWNIDFDTNIVPTRYFSINSSGKSGPFKKTLEIFKPQQTVIQAFDFTVIQ